MQARVMPRMEGVFSAFDASLYPEVTCETCHRSPGYEMPDPRLPQLSPDGRFDLEFRHSPEITMFMYRDVVPAMRSLLGDPDLDCFSCHLPREQHYR